MSITTNASFAAAGLVLTSGLARAQFTVYWYTVDNGGGQTTGGSFQVTGTNGQPDAGTLVGGVFEVAGGFWTGAAACYANCDGSTVAPALNVNDFICFLTRFAAGDTYANCDHSITPPVLNVLDFGCFLNQFAAGCP